MTWVNKNSLTYIVYLHQCRSSFRIRGSTKANLQSFKYFTTNMAVQLQNNNKTKTNLTREIMSVACINIFDVYILNQNRNSEVISVERLKEQRLPLKYPLEFVHTESRSRLCYQSC